jgi:cyclophilin family peptidyl-prolyl cis-trans isomerase
MTMTWHAGRTATVPALVGAAMLLAACGAPAALWRPTSIQRNTIAPDSFVVDITTSAGSVEVVMYREWSPLAVDRAYYLMKHNFYAGARFYRIAEGFVAQFGFSGVPALDSVWRRHPIDDEPVVESNARGIMSFARSGPRTRSYTLFVNLADNPRLDTLAVGGIVGYPPIGRIRAGMEAIDALYGGYAQQPRQDSIAVDGNAYLERHFPQLDSIVRTRVRDP